MSKVHFVLDEAATLGHLEPVDDALDKSRAFGVRLLLLYQSLGQLKTCFPDGQDQTLLSNTTQVFFGVNDPQTAEYVSTRLGEETIVVGSGGVSRGDSSSRSNQGGSYSASRNDSENWQLKERKLLKPEEVTALPARTAITFTPGVPPICTTLTKYFEQNNLHSGGFKRAVGTLAASLILFLFSGMVALALALPNTAERPARQLQPVQDSAPMEPEVSVQER
jgi:type IV secretion system protein VirD4